MADRARTLWLALALGLGGAGCGETPSYRLRWSLDGQPLTSPTQCSELGVLDVVAYTYDEFGFFVDARRFPCFPGSFSDPARTAAGPELPPGTYAIQVRGVTRNFLTWIDDVTLEQEILAADAMGDDYLRDFKFVKCHALADDPSCRPEDIACDCATFEAKEDTTVRIEDLALGPTPQCDDGVDNDQDGLVDGADPSCSGLFSLDSREDRNVSASEFDIRVSFLDGNASAQCSGLGVAKLRATIAGEVFAETTDCNDSLRFLAIIDETLADGPAVDGRVPVTVRVEALGPGGDAVTAPLELAVEVPESFGDFFVLQADFAADTFLEPIVAPARLRAAFSSYEDGPNRSCDASSGDGFLEITQMRVALLDAHGGPIDPPIVAGEIPLDGSDVACSAQQLTTSALAWGDYLVRLEGLSAAGEVCFSNAESLDRAAPSDPVVIVADRVSSSGSCRDCDTDDDCGPLSCTDGICRP